MNRRFLRCLRFLFVSVAGYLLISLIPGWLPYTEHRRLGHENISYDSLITLNPREVDADKEALLEFEAREIDIHFRMFVYRKGDYHNVFQTAPANEGLRLELNGAGHLALVVPEQSGAGKKVRGIYLTRRLQAGQWYLVRIRIDRSHRLQAWLNNLPVIDIRDTTWGYALSDVAVGTGFSRTRPFHGKVDDFTLAFEAWRPKVFFRLALLSLRTLFAAMSLTLAVLLGFGLLKNVFAYAPPVGRAFFARIRRWAHPENLILVHFVFCSVGLLKFIMQAGDLLGRQMSRLAPVPFNDWSLGFVFPSKPADLVTYLVSASALPIYYAGAYLLLKHRRGAALRFYGFLQEKQWRIWAYLALLACGNLWVVLFVRVFGGTPMSPLQAAVWLCTFLVPWWAAPDPAPSPTDEGRFPSSAEKIP
jgi:hypothetical protein